MTIPETTSVLRDEHRRILQVTAALERLIDDGAAPLDFDAIERCVRFFRLFADACHHGKEEDLLFPELESRGMPRESGPIAVMLHEHRLGRELVSAMARALPGARAGDDTSRSRMVNAARGWADLIRAHILKEDHMLFQLADEMVDASACLRLCAAYDVVCASTFEGCTKAQLEALADEIIGEAPAG